MSSRPTTVTCKACRRSLATITAEGLVPESSADSQCSTCLDLDPLYKAMQIADQELGRLVDKSDRNRVKQNALDASRMAHLMFGNWLHNVEAETITHQEQQDTANQTNDHRETDSTSTPAVQRSQSHSPQPASRELKSEDIDSNNQPASSSARSRNLTIPLRPSPKRSHSESTLGHRKRLKFSDSVQSPPAYREASQYARSSKEYEPGRYAPPDDGWLDTSGHVQGWVKFTRMKKSGKKWLEVDEEEETKKKRRKAEDTTNKPQASEDPVLGPDTDARTARLTRRSRRSFRPLPAPQIESEILEAQPLMKGGANMVQDLIEVSEDRSVADTSAHEADAPATGTQGDYPRTDQPTSHDADDQGEEVHGSATEISSTSLGRATDPPHIQATRESNEETGSVVVLPPVTNSTDGSNY